MSTMDSAKRTPWISVPTKGRAMSVEHPCIVKNIEKGIEMIGGSPGISQALEDSNKALSLTFSPQDPAARPIVSNNKQADNVLLRISVPARTNRKRKRGSNDPFVEDQDPISSKKAATYLLRSMADNTNTYSVDAVTAIQNMHIWRSMPDFVYSTSQIKVIQEVKDKLLTQNYQSIRDFDLPRTYGLENTEAVPPSVWSTTTVPQTYTYRQNPSVKITNDPSTGKRIVKNTQAAPKIYSYQVQWDTPDYPTVPMPDIPPLEQQSRIFQKMVEQLRPLFDRRSIWTRRALLNQLDPVYTSYNLVRFCIAYVAFAIRSGPWRDTYCRLGVDPRTDPECRFYQSIMLQLVPKIPITRATGAIQEKANQNAAANEDMSATSNGNATEVQDETNKRTSVPTHSEREQLQEVRRTFHRTWAINKDSESHIFDGVSPIPNDGKVWQLCDMTDPQLVALRDIHELHIRAICDTRYFGWYENGTNAKLRVTLKAKVDALIEGKPLDSALLEEFLKLPDRLQFASDTQPDTTLSGSSNLAERGDTALAEDESGNAAQPVQIANPPAKIAVTRRAWFGENPTKQELEWASLYRAFARTEVGKKPNTGGSGKGRLSKTKLRVRQGYRPSNLQKVPPGSRDQAIEEAPSDRAKKLPTAEGQGDVALEPINVDDDNDDDDDEMGIEEYEDGPELVVDEEVLPSIEGIGFDGDMDEEELDLDIDIKLEEEEEDYGEEDVDHQEQIEIVSSRDETEVADSHISIQEDTVPGAVRDNM